MAVRGAGTTNIQIRGVPTSLRNKVRARATKKGQTMSQYLIDLIRTDTSRPTLDEWLEQARRWTPIPTRMTGAQAVREARRIEEGLEP